MSKSTNRLLAALIAGSVSTFAFAQTSHDPATEPMTHADNKAAKEQAKADREKADAQSDADKAAADARVKDAKKQE